MEKFLNKLERKIGHMAIPNLSLWLISGYIIGYVCYYVKPLNWVLEACMLNPAMVLRGQVWRLLTWVIMPPSYSNIFFYAIMCLLYYQLGTALERNWGTFRYNVYIIGGILFTAIGIMVLYLVLGLTGDLISASMIGYYVNTYYINLSIFLAFALCYPDLKLMLYFIIPIKIKWLAIVYAALVAVSFIQTGISGKIVILMSLANFIIFFLSTRNYKRISPSEVKRKAEFKRAATPPPMRKDTVAGRPYLHKCAICGRTDTDFPELEFRFCSKCAGSHEYCSDHLFTHKHVI